MAGAAAAQLFFEVSRLEPRWLRTPPALLLLPLLLLLLLITCLKFLCLEINRCSFLILDSSHSVKVLIFIDFH